MTRDLIRRGDNERLVFSATPLPQLTDVPVEGTYEVSLNEGSEPDETAAFEFDPNASPAQARDYVVAAASGILMGALNVLWQQDIDLADARRFGAEKIEKIVIGAAQRVGLNKDNPSIADAIRFLEKSFPFVGDKLTAAFGGGLQHHLRDFSHHPSPVGLVCSILMQFTGKGFGTATDGSFLIVDLPAEALKDGMLFGRNSEEKFLYGAINWMLHLISDMAGSSATPGSGTGIPGPLLSFLKEASALPFFRDMSIAHEDKIATFSQWVSKAFNGTLLKDEDGNPLRFDLRTEVGLAGQILTQVPAVLANECIVRGFYTITRFVDELKRCDVSSVKDLARINPSRFLPLNSRALTRMLTVASGTFVVVNTAIAAVCAVVEGSASGEVGAVPLFFMRLNYAGIGRFAFALWADSSYIYEDVEKWWEQHQKSEKGTEVAVYAPLGQDVQRVLDSLLMVWLEDDCRRENKEDKRARKEIQIGAWKRRQLAACDETDANYFRDSADAYRELSALCAREGGESLRLAIAQQLLVFEPYVMDKKLSLSHKWLTDVFVTEQDVIDAATLKRLRSARTSYDRWLSGTYTRLAVGAVLGLTTASGGAALVGALSKDYAEQVKRGCVEWLAQCSVLVEETPTLALRTIEESKARLERAIDADKRTIETLKGAKERDQKKLRKSLEKGVSHLGYAVAELGRLEKKARQASLESGDLAPSVSSDVACAGHSRANP